MWGLRPIHFWSVFLEGHPSGCCGALLPVGASARPSAPESTGVKHGERSRHITQGSWVAPSRARCLPLRSFNVWFSRASRLAIHQSACGICHANSNRGTTGAVKEMTPFSWTREWKWCPGFSKILQANYAFHLKPVPSAQADTCEPIVT